MKTLDFEWKVINPYHVQVRKKLDKDEEAEEAGGGETGEQHYVKMSLQLYQVDYKSFLLDFKSVPNVATTPTAPTGPAAGQAKDSKAAAEQSEDKENVDDVDDSIEDQGKVLVSRSRSLSNDDSCKEAAAVAGDVRSPARIRTKSTSSASNDDAGKAAGGDQPYHGSSHHTMEFFEMCAALITQLAG